MDREREDDAVFKKHIIRVILERFSSADACREEALRDVVKLTLPEMAEREEFIQKIPTLPLSLRVKWAELFSDRLLETVDRRILGDLCQDDQENRAALVLTFIMFLESERMEKIVAEDLRNVEERDG